MTDQIIQEPKLKPNDNLWYVLATLNGEPSDHPLDDDTELETKNRVAWNCCMAMKMREELRAQLVKAGKHTIEELSSFSQEEQEAVNKAFVKRAPSSGSMALEDLLLQENIDFSNVEFDRPFSSDELIFPCDCRFSGAIFSHGASFQGAAFTNVSFEDVTFTGGAFFRGATFLGSVDFYGTTFSELASFSSATFSSSAFFHGAAFIKGEASFEGTRFSGQANFEGTRFCGQASFKGTRFSGQAIFEGTRFSELAIFEGTRFSELAIFEGARFSELAIFESARFSEPAVFESARFCGQASFVGVIFSGEVHFKGAIFGSTVSFENAELKRQTQFAAVKFRSRPPTFFGAKLHEGTAWWDVCWPDPPTKADEASYFVDAYERLKLEMDRLKKHGDELDFFAREQQCRRVVLGFWKGLPITVYGFLSDYGRSYVRPLLLLVALVFLEAISFVLWPSGIWSPEPFDLLPHGVWNPDLSHVREAIGISFANTFSVFGKPLVQPDVLLRLPDWLKAVSTFQTILGLVLLFLFGLGIRNRFRMK